MSPLPVSDLFNLVHSLSKDEKRNFRLRSKIYLKENPKKNYEQLFNALLRMSEYDEKTLRNQVSQAAWMKYMKEEKRNLSEQIERFLQQYHAESHPDGQISVLVQQAELLRQRKIFHRCRKKLEKARKLAVQFDDFRHLMAINEIERRLVKEFHQKKPEQEINRLITEWKQLRDQQADEQEFVFLYDQISLLVRLYYDPRNTEAQREIALLKKHPLLCEAPSGKSFLCLRMYRLSRGIIFHFEGNPEKEYQEYELLINEWKSRPVFIEFFPKLYRHSLSNFLHAAIKLNQYGKIREILNQIEEMKPGNPEEEGEIFQAKALFMMVDFINSGDFPGAVSLIPDIDKGLEVHKEKINPARKSSIQMNIIIALFFHGDIKHAEKRLRKFLQENNTDHRQDLVRFARTLECVMAFDANEPELYQAKSKAALEWMRVNNKLYEFEKTLLQGLSRAMNVPDNSSDSVLKELYNVLMAHQKKEMRPAGLAEVMLWLKSRVYGIPVSKILQADFQSTIPLS